MKKELPPGLIIYNKYEPKRSERELYYIVKARQSIGMASITRQEASRIRRRAREVLSKIPNKCICGYAGDVEVAHLHPLAKFAIGTPESIINHPRNLRKLCRNCHRELDSKTMDQERYCALMNHDGKPLTEAEIIQGWHFCIEADGLLVGPGMDEMKECTCFQQNTKPHHLSPSEADLCEFEAISN